MNTNERQIIELSNGKLVANFSSPHAFNFTDGNILPAKSESESERLKVNFHEDIDEDGDVVLSFSLSDEVCVEIVYWQEKFLNKEVNVVFCPLPMITAMKQDLFQNIKTTPFRAVRIEDRINKLVSIEKQCL
jgi:hypothetical protein